MKELLENEDYIGDLDYLNSLSIWKDIEGKTILVTGATGLIGSAIVDAIIYHNKFANSKINVIAISRTEERIKERFCNYLLNNEFSFYAHDISKPLNISQKIDFIIHAASNANPKFYSEKPVDTMLGNILGANNLLNLSIKNNSKFLYVSSGEVYGIADKKINGFDENYSGYIDFLNSRSCYPSSKRATETLCISYKQQYGIDVIIARPCHVYGVTALPNDNRIHKVFMEQALNGDNIILKSDGKQMRSYCNVIDAVSGILTILTKGLSGEAYNISTPNSNISIYELASIIAKQAQVDVKFDLPTNVEKKAFNPMNNAILNSNKLLNLGWNPIYNAESGIEHTMKILRKIKN